jgi:stage II sporulation protein AB (anti-sigma F factor)
MKKIINEMKLRLPAISTNEAVARSVVTAFCAELNPTLEELADVRCAVSEAVTNVIVHAYKEKEESECAFVYISVRLYTPAEISVEISDRGCGIEDVEAARRPAFTTGEPTERCGMGFLVMESFMDSLTVKSKVGRGTSVLMRKIINPSRKDGYGN